MTETTETIWKFTPNTQELERSLADVNASLARLANSLEAAGKKADEAAKKPASSVEKMRRGAGEWGGAMAGGFALAAVGAAKAAGALLDAGKAVTAFISDAAALRAELDPFFERGLLPPVDVSSLDAASASAAAMGTALKGVGLAVVSEFQPAITTGATLVVAFALAIGDLVDQAAEAVHQIAAWYRSLSGPARTALGLVSAGTLDFIGVLDDLQSGLSDSTVSSSEYIQQAQALLGTQQQLDVATRKAAASSRDQAAAEKEAAAAERERQEALRAGMARLKEDAAATTQATIAAFGELDAALADLENSAQAYIEGRIRDQEAMVTGATETIAATSSLAATFAERAAEQGKESALALFRVSQAAGLAEVGINTAIAITKALATLGPIAGPVAAVGIGATGAAQAAIIASQSPPAANHLGSGGLGARDPLAPDEAMYGGRRVLQQERVINSLGVSVLGEQGVNDLNAGRAPAAAPVAFLGWKHLLDHELGRSAKVNSRFGRALRQTRSPTRGW